MHSGQDDIESLQHAINLYSKQLPVGTAEVSLYGMKEAYRTAK